MSAIDQKTRYDSDEDTDSGVNHGLSGNEIDDLERNAEVGSLEDTFNAPAISDEDRNTSPEAEEKSKLADSDSEDDDADWETDVSEASRARQIKMKRFAAIGGATGFGIGALFGASVFLSGPLQFVHLAKMMQGIHLFSGDESGNERASKIAKWLRYNKAPQNMRLNAVERKIAASTEAKFKKAGMTPVYEGVNGRLTRYDIDVDAYAQAKGLDATPDAVGEHIKNNLGVDLDLNTSSIDTSELSYLKNRRLSKGILREVGLHGVTGAERNRIQVKKSGSTINPIKKYIDQPLLEKGSDFWKKLREDRTKRNTEGVGQDAKSGKPEPGEPDPEGNPTEDPEAVSNKSELDSAIQETGSAGDELVSGADLNAPDSAHAQLKGKLGGAMKVGGGVAAITGLVCLAKGISENVDLLKHTNVVMPLMRIGWEMIGVGNQVMAGTVDFATLGYYNQMLNDPANGSIWSSAMSIKSEFGQIGGEDILPEARIPNEENVVTKFVDSIPAIDTVCGAVNSTAGQIATFAIDLSGGPASALIGTAASYFAAPAIIGALTNWLAGAPIDVNVRGAALGNFLNYGARLAASSSGMLGAGAALDPVSSMEWRDYRLALEKEEMQNMSIAERLFNPMDYRSLAGRMIDSSNPDVSTNVASIVTAPLRMFSSITTLGRNLVAPRVSAQAAGYDYGFKMYGFTISELKNTAIDNPFENSQIVNDLLNGAEGGNYKKRAKGCFGTTFDSNNSPDAKPDERDVPAFYKVESGGPVDVDGENVTLNCADKSLEWLRIRAYIYDTQIGDSMACKEGDEDSCKQIGLSSSSGATNNTQTAGNANIYVIGDSLTVGMRDTGGLEAKLTEKGWNVVNRPITAVGGKPLSWGIEQVKASTELNAQTGTVLVNLGTNDGGTAGPAFSKEVDDMVAAIKQKAPTAKIFWTDLYGEGEFCAVTCVNFATKFAELNGILKEKATQYSMTIISWSTSPIAAEHVGNNEVHPYTGYPQMAEFVVSALGNPPSGGAALTGDGFAFPLIVKKSDIKNPGMFKEGSTDKGGHPYTAYDILVNAGTEIAAFTKGKVTRVGEDKCPGRSIGITDEEQNITVTYMHMDFEGHIGMGTVVNPGDRIGKVGAASPNGCGVAHLHIDAVTGGTRPACKRESCPPENASKFIDIGKQLSDAFKKVPE